LNGKTAILYTVCCARVGLLSGCAGTGFGAGDANHPKRIQATEEDVALNNCLFKQ
jgi:hypothetical protein